jgi:AcrR family transcriptional regulator
MTCIVCCRGATHTGAPAARLRNRPRGDRHSSATRRAGADSRRSGARPQARRRDRSGHADAPGQRGFAGLTIEAIARHAGVARTTVYRRWPDRDALRLDLLRGLLREVTVSDRGRVRGDLIEFLSDQLGFLESEAGRLYPSLGVQAGVDPAAGEVLRDLVQRRKAALCALLRRGIERRQIRSDVDSDLGFFLLWGPVYYRYLGALAGKAPIEPDFIVELVDSVLLGIGTAAPNGANPPQVSPSRRSSATTRAHAVADLHAGLASVTCVPPATENTGSSSP